MINELENLFNSLSQLISEEMEAEINGTKLFCSNKDGEITIKIVKDENNEVVENFKKNIKELDDSIFLEALERAKEVMDIKEFNYLLDNYDEKVLDMINDFSEIIVNVIDEKEASLAEFKDKFNIK